MESKLERANEVENNRFKFMRFREPLITNMERLKELFDPWSLRKTLLTVGLVGFALMFLFVILIYSRGHTVTVPVDVGKSKQTSTDVVVNQKQDHLREEHVQQLIDKKFQELQKEQNEKDKFQQNMHQDLQSQLRKATEDIKDLQQEVEDLQDELDETSREVKDSKMPSSNPDQKMLFEVLRYRYESAQEKNVPHVITFEEASCNVGHAMNVVTGTFLVPQDGLYKFEVQGSVLTSDVRFTLNGIPTGTSVATALMHLTEQVGAAPAYRQSGVRHIYASTTATLKKDDKVFLRQENSGAGFYYKESKAIRLSFTGEILNTEDS